jgi:alcohol dehydrogenase YqhD (iron-dependent ADH family)
MSEHTYPKFSILDPTLTYTIPANYAAYSAVDSISHLIEGYFTHKDEWSPIHDRYVEGLVKTIMESTEKILADPNDYQGRSTMMWAATLAWNGLGTAGIGDCQIPNHMLEHPISGIYDIAHGAGLSIVIPAWTWWASESQPKRIAQMGREVFNVNETDDIKAAQECSKGFKAWFDKIGSPTSFSAAGIEEPDFEALAEQAIKLGKIWGITNYTKEELIEIYKLCV